jgi:hypothetical protein
VLFVIDAIRQVANAFGVRAAQPVRLRRISRCGALVEGQQ